MSKILIVEDDELLSEMYKKLFMSEKYDVSVAKNGQDGLEKAKTAKPDLILLDIMLPGMNGLQILEKLKNDSETQNIAVVILTNISAEQDAERALSLGAVKYVVKSQHKPKDVGAIVRQILGGSTKSDIPSFDKN